jgi:hypothetical protein
MGSVYDDRSTDRAAITGQSTGMDESFSPVIFVYGMALILGVGKACTLLIWRSLERPRPGLRQDLREAWDRLTRRTFLKQMPETQASSTEAAAPDRVRQP